MTKLINLNQKKTGFDTRIVRYEDIHSISDKDFDNLFYAINPVNNDFLLDLGCGYGAVTREIIRKKAANNSFNFFLSDVSRVQLNRAVSELTNLFGQNSVANNMEFYLDDITNSMLKSNYFDKVTAKMVIHEIKKNEQHLAINQIFRLLKPGGKFIIWDLFFHRDIQHFFQRIIRKKDQLAGFHELVTNRYLFNADELMSLLSKSGFIEIKINYEISYILETKKRLHVEFDSSIERLRSWNEFILNELDLIHKTNEISSILLGQEKDNLIIKIPKSIITAHKPLI